MCLIVFAINTHKHYKLIVATNRDEFFERPAEPVHLWNHSTTLYAGKDLKEGGTWMGINEQGRFAAITNYRDGREFGKKYPVSRGRIVTDFFTYNGTPNAYLGEIDAGKDKYAGFNLLAGDAGKIFYYSNRGGGKSMLDKGVFGLSNAFLNTPWFKVSKTIASFKKLLKSEEFEPAAVFDILAERSKAPPEELPDTHIPAELEYKLSSPFINFEGYGTRSGTVLTVDQSDRVIIIEKTYGQDGAEQFETKAEFTIKS